MKKTGILLSLALVLGASAPAFAVVADWAEEMTTTVAASDKGWTNFEGNWGSTVTVIGGDVWRNTSNNGNIGTANNPTVNEPKYTIEYKWRFLNSVPTSGLVVGAWLYNSGDGPNADPIGRTRHQHGYIPGPESDMNFEVVGAGDNRHNYLDLGAVEDFSYWNTSGVFQQWQTSRVVFDNTAGPPQMSYYLNGNLLATVSHQDGNSLLVGQDDPGLYFGAQDGGTAMDVEWDYIRIVTDVVPINEAITAVPEPSSLCLLGLSALALVRRRRS